MLRKVMTIAALFGVVAVAANAQAGAVSALNGPSVNGGLNILQDTDFESLIDVGTPGINSGDFFVGVFSIDLINSISPFNPAVNGSFTGILIAALDGDPTVGGLMKFRALTVAEYTAAQLLFPALPGRVNSASAILVYDKAPDFVNNPNGFINPNVSINGAIASASTHPTLGSITKALELGFVGTTYAEAQLNTPPALAGGLRFSLALNVTQNPLDLGFGKITTSVSNIFQVDGTTALPKAHVHIGGRTNTDLPGVFQFQTNADMKFILPEPSSLTLLGLGALGLFGRRLRRRNAA